MRSAQLTVVPVALTWLALAALVVPSRAAAASESDFAYPFSRVWTAAVRLLRVDFGCAITEKDREDGYFLFDYDSGHRSVPGSVELVKTRVRGVDGVRVVLKVPAMPQYVERMMLARLGRKLEKELGEPRLQAPTRAERNAGHQKETPAGEREQKRQQDSNSHEGNAPQKQPDKAGG